MLVIGQSQSQLGMVSDYLIMPEILTEFVMRLHTISYKEATAQLYANNLPTTHHIDTLLCEIHTTQRLLCNDALQAGSVKFLSAGNFACLFLFHGISPISKKQLFMRSEPKQLNSLIITIVNRYVFPFSSGENILRVIPLFVKVPPLSTTQ